MKKLFLPILILLIVSSCSLKKKSTFEYDFIITPSKSEQSKGTILLIHGSAPLNIDARIPVENDKSIFSRLTLYKDLAEALNKLGWDVARYGKYGVFKDRIDYEILKEVDFKLSLEQLQHVWQRIPRDRPFIVFAASGGTVLAPHLSLDEADALIMLGAVSKTIKDVFIDRFDEEEGKEEERKRIISAYKMKRDEMFNKEWSAGKAVDIFNLADNWTFFEKYKDLPMLVLHGEDDKAVKVYQSKIWKDKLPKHDVTLMTKPKGNHLYGIGKSFDMNELAVVMDRWLEAKLK